MFFDGLTISRSNKENFTNLLIGEESVEIGKKIDVLKRELWKETKIVGDLKDLLKGSLLDFRDKPIKIYRNKKDR